MTFPDRSITSIHSRLEVLNDDLVFLEFDKGIDRRDLKALRDHAREAESLAFAIGNRQEPTG